MYGLGFFPLNFYNKERKNFCTAIEFENIFFNSSYLHFFKVHLRIFLPKMKILFLLSSSVGIYFSDLSLLLSVGKRTHGFSGCCLHCKK